MADITGKMLGKYQLVERVGRGGMAEVYRAFQPGLDRFVAVKILHGFLLEDTAFLNRFRREAQAVAGLRHNNIVQVFDFDNQDDLTYMVMEFVDGVTLRSLLDERFSNGRALDMPEIICVMNELCSAIGYAHSEGVIHRDINPANIMLTADKRIVLTDFGVVRIIGATSYTASGEVNGTPEYMSPEQGQGAPGDERSDIYSLGIVLYEALTGDVPFEGASPVSVLLKHLTQPVPHVHEIVPALSGKFDRVVHKALAKNPKERYQNAAELWNELRNIPSGRLDFPAQLFPVRSLRSLEKPAPTPSGLPLATSFASSAARPRLLSNLGTLALVSNIVLICFLAYRSCSSTFRGISNQDVAGDPYSEMLDQGNGQLQAADFKTAFKTFNSLLQENPTSIPILLGRVEANLGIGNSDQARKDITRAIQLGPKDARPLLAQARFSLKYESAFSWDTVKAQINSAMELAPSLAEAFYTRGWATLYYAPPSKAVAGPDPFYCIPELHTAVIKGNAATALPDLQKAVDLDPKQREFHLTLSDALYATNALLFAREQVNDALRLAPGYYPGRWRRAILNFTLGDYSSANDDFTAILGLPEGKADPAKWLTWRALAGYYRENYAESLKDANAALAVAPESAAAFYVQGVSYYYQGRYDDALTSLKKVEGHKPSEYDCPFINQRAEFEINADEGSVLVDKGEFARAIEKFNQTISLYPEWYLGYLYRGQALEKIGNTTAALEDFQRVMTLNPSDNSRSIAQGELAKLQKKMDKQSSGKI